MILRAISDDNTKLDKCDRVTIDSIRNHAARHFPVQNIARATLRSAFMASIRVRQRKDGSTYTAVLYTLNGKQTSSSFNDHAEARQISGAGQPRQLR